MDRTRLYYRNHFYLTRRIRECKKTSTIKPNATSTTATLTKTSSPGLPPDPGEAGKVTLEGIDSDQVHVQGDAFTVSFAAPKGWRVADSLRVAGVANIYSPKTDAEIAGGSEMSPPDASITIERRGPALTPDAYIASQANGWYLVYKNRVSQTVSGYPAIIVDDLDAEVPHYPIATAFIFVGNQVVLITGDQITPSDFTLILASVRIQ